MDDSFPCPKCIDGTMIKTRSQVVKRGKSVIGQQDDYRCNSCPHFEWKILEAAPPPKETEHQD